MMQPSSKRIESVAEFRKDAFAGQPVFILCTGPSLALDVPALGELREHWTWGVNNLIRWPLLPFLPSLWAYNEAYSDLGAWKMLHDETRVCGFIRAQPYYDSNRFMVLDQPREHIIQVGKLAGFQEEQLTFTYPLWGVSAVGTAIQPAIWLGFDPIYLLGLDLTNQYVHRWGARPVSYQHGGSHWENMMLGLELIRDTLWRHGRTIVNLSRGSQETVLPRMTLPEVLSQMPVAV